MISWTWVKQPHMLTTFLTESIKKLGLMPGIYEIMWMEGGGMDNNEAICLLMILDIEWGPEWWGK